MKANVIRINDIELEKDVKKVVTIAADELLSDNRIHFILYTDDSLAVRVSNSEFSVKVTANAIGLDVLEEVLNKLKS